MIHPIRWWPWCVGAGIIIFSPILSIPLAIWLAYEKRRVARERDRLAALREGTLANARYTGTTRTMEAAEAAETEEAATEAAEGADPGTRGVHPIPATIPAPGSVSTGVTAGAASNEVTTPPPAHIAN